MKTSKLISKWTLLFVMAGLVVITSCGEDEESGPAPEANFSSTVEGTTIVFADSSTNADTYLWEFGDGETSDQASPTHTFASKGSYVVKLTVSNSFGEDSKQEVFEIANIAIDGSFDDWADIPSLTSTSTGFLTDLKVDNLGNNKLFVYVSATQEMADLTGEGNVIQIMLDTDNDIATGRGISWYWFQPGEDYLIEGNLLGAEGTFTLFQNNPESAPGTWDTEAWIDLGYSKAEVMATSELQEVAGGYAYEISIDLSSFPTEINANAIRIGVHHTQAWGANSFIPAQWNETECPECTLASYDFN